MTNEVTQEIEDSQAVEDPITKSIAATTPEAPSIAETTESTPPVAETAIPQAETPVSQSEASAADAEAPVSQAVEPATEASPLETPAAETETPISQPEPAEVRAEAPVSQTTPPAVHTETANGAAADDASAPADIDFGAILEQFEQEQTTFHPGELVEGKVIGISDRGVLIDFGYKSEGVAPLEEFAEADGSTNIAVGDTVEVVLRSMHSGDGPPQLSRHDALGRRAWDDLEKAFNDEATVTGVVVDKTKGGLRVDLNGIEAFLPGSQIDSRPAHGLDSYKGQEIEARIIKFSRRRNNVVLSRKILTDEVVGKLKEETLSRIDVGYIVDGTIKNLTEYGAFVDIGGIDGLLHVTDMSWGRLHHPSDLFKVGEHIQVKVLKLDREREKISLGYKQLLPDPWSTVIEVYPVNSKLKGKVSSVTDYGVFVELEPGVEGLVHVSEISWSRRTQSPKRLFNRGDEVEAQVLGVDMDERRISLGMKQFQENPWARVDERYPVGTKIHGRIRNITDFGAFVELEEGIDGLVHVSDITWAKKIKHPKDVLKKDQEVDAIVTSIDKHNQRLSLSMKDLTPSAWESFVATHRPGDVVRGKVSRFTNFGIFVELGEGLEGLCHISELADERVDRPESVAELGQEMDFKILRIEPGDQKIGLSHRAVGKEDTPVVDTKMYSSEAKGGMASLAELANLKFDTAPTETTAEPAPKEKKAKKAKAGKTEEPAVEAAVAESAAETAEETSPEASEAGAEEPAEVTAEEISPEGSEARVEETAEVTAEETSPEPSEPVAEVSAKTAEPNAPEAEAETSPETTETAKSAEEPASEEAAPEAEAEAEAEPKAEVDTEAKPGDEKEEEKESEKQTA